MTISTVTTETLKDFISGQGYGIAPSAVVAICEQLLAVREAQPVWVDTEIHEAIQDILQGKMSGAGRYVSIHRNQYPKGFKQLMPIFTAPPLPAVPEMATPDNIDILASTYAPRAVTYQWDVDERNAAADSWNACRAAMLNHSGGKLDIVPADTRRMDWLVAHHVEVRKPLLYGSEKFFTAQTLTDKEDDYHATSLREQIDAAMAAAPTPTHE